MGTMGRWVRLHPELDYAKNYGGSAKLTPLWNLEAGADFEKHKSERSTVAWSLFWFMENAKLGEVPAPRVPNVEEL